MSLAIYLLIVISRVFTAPYLLTGQTSFMIFTFLFVLPVFPATHPGLLALLPRAILLILYTWITLYRFATVAAGNCWDHCENLSKLKDADFQQLTINLFYLITRKGFNRKELSFYSAKFLSKMELKKNDIPTYSVQCNEKKSNLKKGGTIFCRKVVSV